MANKNLLNKKEVERMFRLAFRSGWLAEYKGYGEDEFIEKNFKIYWKQLNDQINSSLKSEKKK